MLHNKDKVYFWARIVQWSVWILGWILLAFDICTSAAMPWFSLLGCAAYNVIIASCTLENTDDLQNQINHLKNTIEQYQDKVSKLEYLVKSQFIAASELNIEEEK